MSDDSLKVSHEELKRSKKMWQNFTKAVKWSVLALVALLILMALFLL